MLNYFELDYILSNWCMDACIDPHDVTYNIDEATNTLTIYTDRPGDLLGQNGWLFNEYNEKLSSKIVIVEAHRIMSFKEWEDHAKRLYLGNNNEDK